MSNFRAEYFAWILTKQVRILNFKFLCATTLLCSFIKSHSVQVLAQFGIYNISALLKWISQSFSITVLYLVSWSAIRNCQLDSFWSNCELQMRTIDGVQLLRGVQSTEADYQLVWVNTPETHGVWMLHSWYQQVCSTSLLLWGCTTFLHRYNFSLLSWIFFFLQSAFRGLGFKVKRLPCSPWQLKSEPQRKLENNKDPKYIIEWDSKIPDGI